MIKSWLEWISDWDMKWMRLNILFLTMMLIHGHSLEAQSLFTKIKGPAIPYCVPCRTCDDYCGKPRPCTANPTATTCDDYVRKPQPCAYAIGQFACDDYCRKPTPKVCSECYEPTNYFESDQQVYGRGPVTTYEDPYGNWHLLRDPLLQPQWADQFVTQHYVEFQVSPNRPTSESGQVFEARSTLNHFDRRKRIR